MALTTVVLGIVVLQQTRKIKALSPTPDLFLITQSQRATTPQVLADQVLLNGCLEACYDCCDVDSCLEACNNFVTANPFTNLADVDTCFCPDSTRCLDPVVEPCISIATEPGQVSLNQNDPPPGGNERRLQDQAHIVLEDGSYMELVMVPHHEPISPANTVKLAYVHASPQAAQSLRTALGTNRSLTVKDASKKDFVTFIPHGNDYIKITYKDPDVFNRLKLYTFTVG
ncbi:MAG: hypothetical protein D6730_18330 [Bacteroidetes bacterium]|nr:MAG: hypothetical protein D6730_18330 [Bacteroidota bacterium]